MRKFFRKPVTLIAVGLVLGLIAAPAAAQAGLTINSIWRQLRPKMDARYVQQPGVPGPQGPPGVAGLPSVYTYSQQGSIDIPGPATRVVATLTLPAGRWLIEGQIVESMPRWANGDGYCDLLVGGQTLDYSFVGSTSGTWYGTPHVMAVADVAEGTVVNLKCAGQTGANPSRASHRTLVATAVAVP